MALQVVDPHKHRKLPIIAIDGPAGAGKSTVARLLAFQFRFTLVDTGALYRCLAWAALEKNIPLDSGPALASLCENLKIQFGGLEPHGSGIPRQRVFCLGLDVSEAIREPHIGNCASQISKLPEVREAFLDLQRNLAAEGGIVMEGRDIGTVIFPDAELKFFLTASVESRARRRFEELKASGMTMSYEQVLKETSMRDEQDSKRAIAPLKQAADARLVDSSDKNLEQVVADMSAIIREHLKA